MPPGAEGVRLTLFVPLSIAAVKRDKLRASGADLVIAGPTCEQSEIMARAEAASSGRVYVSPYNDARVVAGQGTVGLEIAAALPDIEDVLVPVGGGGLAAGIAGAVKAAAPATRVWGVEPIHSAFLSASLRAGRLVEFAEKPTLADAVAGGIEPGSITFELCRHRLDGILTVTEPSHPRGPQVAGEAPRRSRGGGGGAGPGRAARQSGYVPRPDRRPRRQRKERLPRSRVVEVAGFA